MLDWALFFCVYLCHQTKPISCVSVLPDQFNSTISSKIVSGSIAMLAFRASSGVFNALSEGAPGSLSCKFTVIKTNGYLLSVWLFFSGAHSLIGAFIGKIARRLQPFRPAQSLSLVESSRLFPGILVRDDAKPDGWLFLTEGCVLTFLLKPHPSYISDSNPAVGRLRWGPKIRVVSTPSNGEMLEGCLESPSRPETPGTGSCSKRRKTNRCALCIQIHKISQLHRSDSILPGGG